MKSSRASASKVTTGDVAIFEASQIKYPPGHPQLPLLASEAAQAAQDLVFELPARLVWNEDRTQRITSAFAARVNQIHADVGTPVSAGSALATLTRKATRATSSTP